MVSVGEAEDWIYEGLWSLPWRVYLVAMWILCGELRTLYAPWTHEDEVPLLASTMDLVRDVVVCGETDRTARRGRELARAWRQVLQAREAEAVSGGLLNAWATFEGLAEEIGGLAGRYSGSHWVMNAATERWRDWDRPGPMVVNWEQAEEVDDSSPMGQTLALFGQVVSGVSGTVSPEWEPARIRAAIFGEMTLEVSEAGPSPGARAGQTRRDPSL